MTTKPFYKTDFFKNSMLYLFFFFWLVLVIFGDNADRKRVEAEKKADAQKACCMCQREQLP